MLNILIFKSCIVAAEAIALITGIITWRKWRHSHFKWVAVYLFFIVLSEATGYYLNVTRQLQALDMLYNVIVIPAEVSCICWLYYKSPPVKFRKSIIILWCCYLLLLLLEHFYLNSTAYMFKSFSYTAGNCIIVTLVLRYFTWLVRSDDILTFKTNIMFWLSAGILVFYGGTLPYYGLYNILAKDMDMFITYTWIMLCFNYAMYFLFTAGLIWGKAK